MNIAQLSESIPANHAPLFLEFLTADEPERTRIAGDLRALLDRQRAAGTASRGFIPCRRPLGLYVLLSRSIAGGLIAALELSPPELSQLCEQLNHRARVFPDRSLR